MIEREDATLVTREDGSPLEVGPGVRLATFGGMAIVADPTMPPHTVEMRQNGKAVARMINVGE